MEVEMPCWRLLCDIRARPLGGTRADSKWKSRPFGLKGCRPSLHSERVDRTTKRILDLRIFLLCVWTILAAFYPPSADAKDEFRFDPGKCKQAGVSDLYIALGDIVVHLPWSSRASYFLNSIPPAEQRMPPDASEQSGCESNPLQVWMFGSLSGVLWRGAEAEPGVAVTLYWNWRPQSNADDDKSEWRGEDLGLHALRGVCAKATTIEVLPNGLKACRIKPSNPPEARVEDWAATFSSDPRQYATPLGRPFVVDCGPGIFSTRIGDCEVNYAATPALGISYKFNPYHGAKPLSIDAVIGFDRNLRQRLGEATVHEYKWPGPLLTRHGSDQ
nr:hypothetical protein [uncultured Bradyrhizobium sp.]